MLTVRGNKAAFPEEEDRVTEVARAVKVETEPEAKSNEPVCNNMKLYEAASANGRTPLSSKTKSPNLETDTQVKKQSLQKDSQGVTSLKQSCGWKKALASRERDRTCAACSSTPTIKTKYNSFEAADKEPTQERTSSTSSRKHGSNTTRRPTFFSAEKILLTNVDNLEDLANYQYHIQLSEQLNDEILHLQALCRKYSVVFISNQYSWAAHMMNNVFNEAAKKLNNSRANTLCQQIDTLIIELLKVLDNLWKAEFTYSSAFQHLERMKTIAPLSEHFGLLLSLHCASERAADTVSSLVQICFQLKQIVSFVDVFSAELTSQRLLKFGSPKAASSRQLGDQLSVGFTHLDFTYNFGSTINQHSFLHIDIDTRVSSTTCQFSWKYPHRLGSQLAQLLCRLDQWDGFKMTTCVVKEKQPTLQLSLEAGKKFKVKVSYFAKYGCIVALGEVSGKAVFSNNEMEQLYSKACAFVGKSEVTLISQLYRCKPESYFNSVMKNGGIMQKYMKDFSGHAASCINGTLEGLFFSAQLRGRSRLPNVSVFGNRQFLLPTTAILDPERINLYFADFYCNTRQHYVTVVVCIKNSEADNFCSGQLILLDVKTNNFLRMVDHATYVLSNKIVLVEIFYTESVELSLGKIRTIQAIGSGTSHALGVPHNKICEICNLYWTLRGANLKTVLEDALEAMQNFEESDSVKSIGGDSVSYIHLFGVTLQLFYELRNLLIRSEKGFINSLEPISESNQALQTMAATYGVLLSKLNEKLIDRLMTSRLNFITFFDTLGKACQKIDAPETYAQVCRRGLEKENDKNVRKLWNSEQKKEDRKAKN